MTETRHGMNSHGHGREVWLGIAKFLGLLLMVTLFFLLAQSMVEHHFFTGGAQNNHNSPTGP
jgi:hypothetical protein